MNSRNNEITRENIILAQHFRHDIPKIKNERTFAFIRKKAVRSFFIMKTAALKTLR